jgi:hypothetical protein
LSRARRSQRSAVSTKDAGRDHRREAWLRGHLDVERRFILDVVAAAVAEIHKQIAEEIELEVGKLHAEFNVSRAHDSGQVVDLPSPLLRKQSNAT